VREEAKWWIEDAKRSLVKAETNLNFGYYEDCVFHCHQVIEKLFKGLRLQLTRRRPEKIHNLYKLYLPLKKHLKLTNELEEFLRELTPYYKITRYPDAAMGVPYELISENFARKCLKKTKRIMKCSLKVISKG